MSPEFAATVCEGFYGSLEELPTRDLPAKGREILSRLQPSPMNETIADQYPRPSDAERLHHRTSRSQYSGPRLSVQ